MKNEHEEKNYQHEKNIVKLHKEKCKCDRGLTDHSKISVLEQQIDEFQKRFLEFKNEFATKFDKFELMLINKSTKCFTDINNKFNVVTAKLKAENVQKPNEENI